MVRSSTCLAVAEDPTATSFVPSANKEKIQPIDSVLCMQSPLQRMGLDGTFVPSKPDGELIRGFLKLESGVSKGVFGIDSVPEV